MIHKPVLPPRQRVRSSRYSAGARSGAWSSAGPNGRAAGGGERQRAGELGHHAGQATMAQALLHHQQRRVTVNTAIDYTRRPMRCLVWSRVVLRWSGAVWQACQGEAPLTRDPRLDVHAAPTHDASRREVRPKPYPVRDFCFRLVESQG